MAQTETGRRVVLWGSFGKEEIAAALAAGPGVSLAVAADASQAAEMVADAEILVLPANFYDASLAARIAKAAPRLRLIQLLTAGYENLDRHGVPADVTVSSAGDAWSPAVAEHVMALLLARVKGLPGILANHAQRGWDRGFSATMGSLAGSTLVVVGYGSIGRAVARRARGFDMRVIGIARTARDDEFADEVRAADALHGALAEADAIVLSLPLSDDTAGLMGTDAFAACKPGAILVNVARGGLIDNAALIAALEDGTLSGAALDVTSPEPLPPDDPLWLAPNLIVSPHVAGASGPRGRQRLADFAAANVARFLAGEPVQSPVRGLPALGR